jgi:hypothetical protein
MTPRTTRERPRRLVGVVVGITLALLATPATAGAQTGPAGFKAGATADSGRFRFTIPDRQIVEDVFDGGGATAVSALDPYAATSYAALPWPGELAILGPSLFQAVTGQTLPGSYPFYVSASHPTAPKQDLSDPSGMYHLSATAAQGQTGSSAVFGQMGDSGGGGSQAVTTITVEGNKVVAVAETLNKALDVGGGALKIAAVRSRSETTYTEGDAEPTSKTDLLIEGGSAGEMNFGFGPEGFVVAKDGTPIPAAEGLEALNTALKPAGISIRIASGRSASGTAVADAFEIVFRQGAQGREFTGVVITLRFGGATSSVKVGQ